MGETKKAKKVVELPHPIANRVFQLDKKLIEEEDYEKWPTDPQEFLEWLKERTNVCERCALCETRTTVVQPDGAASARIMLVGEGPGYLENLSGIPLVGPLELRASRCGTCARVMTCYDNRILNRPGARSGKAKEVECKPEPTDEPTLPKRAFFLQSAGSVLDGIILNNWKYAYPRHNWIEYYNRLHPMAPWAHESPWYITNTVLCRSFDQVKLKDTTPPMPTRAECKRWLAMQWAAVEPRVMVALGRPALEVLMGSQERAKSIAAGDIVDTKFGPVLFQFHPAFYMREPNREVRAYGMAKIGETLRQALEMAGLPT